MYRFEPSSDTSLIDTWPVVGPFISEVNLPDILSETVPKISPVAQFWAIVDHILWYEIGAIYVVNFSNESVLMLAKFIM